MAYFTLGPEFYKKEPELYYRIINRVKGEIIKVDRDIHFIRFDSNKYGKNEHCVAVIKESAFHRKPYFKQIISYSYSKL